MELSKAGYSQRNIAAELGLSKTTVNEILKRYRQSQKQD
jgi:predicted transcriptional regulator